MSIYLLVLILFVLGNIIITTVEVTEFNRKINDINIAINKINKELNNLKSDGK